MTLEAPYRVWAWRHTVAKGWHWESCRICERGTAGQWLDVFKLDEPTVHFDIARTKPKDL